MKYPKISIVTPSYNQSEYLEKTILSIIEQGYPNLQYIIIDGGSTDFSVDIIKKYEHHLSYWVSEKDNGQSHAINKGLEKASGEIFNWINSDDYLEPGALFEVAKCFNENPDRLAIGGYCRLFDEKKQTAIISRIGKSGNTEENIINFWMNQPSTFYKTEIIKGFGGVNESLHYCMDLELWFRFLSQYGISKLKYTNHLLSHFRHHNSSKTESLTEKFILENNLLLSHICKELKLPTQLNDAFNIPENYYTPQKKWHVNAISKKQFKVLLSKKYHHLFWESKKYDALRYALWTLLKSGNLKTNRYYLSLCYRALCKC
jgi:glycosyltransferase involved in cell wall biosynthesis